MRRTLVLVSLALAAFAVLAPAALASRVEEQQGAALVRDFRAGGQSCASLSSTQFELVGEYVMSRMIGSPAAHDAMNARIKQMMSPRGEVQAHIYLAQRHLGCTQGVRPPASFGGMMGVVGTHQPGDGGGMGMMGANGAGSSNNGQYNGGSGMTGGHHNGGGGWSTVRTAVVVLLGGLAVALILLVMKLSRRREPSPDSAP